MKKSAIEKVMFSQLFIDPSHTDRDTSFYLYPEMPVKQIRHYIQLSSERSYPIVLQLKPNAYLNSFTEVSGEIIFINPKKQIVLKNPNHNTVHLLQIEDIHHLRLAK